MGVFRTRDADGNLEPHLLYESLWMLGAVEEKSYENYGLVVKQFEEELPLYLGSNSRDIREMAIIVAGNKAIGKEADILKVVEADPQQFWVLANHILEKRIGPHLLLPTLAQPHPVPLQILELLTNQRNDPVTVALLEAVPLQALIKTTHHPSPEIHIYAIRIIGNVAAEKSDHAEAIVRMQFLDSVPTLLSSVSHQ